MTAIALKLITAAPKTAARRPSLRRRPLAQRLEVAGVLSLLGSSAAYALFALAHLG